MGRLKQLLPWDGTTLVTWQVRQMREAGAGDVVVVLGHAARKVAEALAGDDCRIVLNEDYRQGRASSVRAGAAAIGEGTDALLVLSVDQPRPAWLSRLLVERWRASGAAIVSPRFVGHFGHPILLSGRLLPELRSVEESSLGMRAVIEAHAAEADSVAIDNASLDVDLNTQQDYERALASLQANEWQPPVTL